MPITKEEAEARLTAYFAKLNDRNLIDTLRLCETQLKAKSCKDRQARNQTRTWLIEELERRFPAASDAVQTAFEAAEDAEQANNSYVEVDYVGVLTAAVETALKERS